MASASSSGDGCITPKPAGDLVSTACSTNLTVHSSFESLREDSLLSNADSEMMTADVSYEVDKNIIQSIDVDIKNVKDLCENIICDYEMVKCDDQVDCSESEKEVFVDGEPAMVLRGPQDTSALTGDRVCLKATYIGFPVPEVSWVKSVSLFL